MRRNAWRGMLLALLASIVAAGASAESRFDAARRQIEASMLVTGWIDVEPDGSVSGHRIDDPDALPGHVVGLVEGAVPGWRFEPVLVDGEAVAAKARMYLRVVARKLGDDQYILRIGSASFGEDRPGEYPSSSKLRAPDYPRDALTRGVEGTVYLVIRVGREGDVEEVVAEQVNLRAIAGKRSMEMLRDSLAKAALHAARWWKFEPPTRGEAVDEPYWSVRVPVVFELDGAVEPEYGAWSSYVAGPRHPAPWIEEESGTSPDALAGGGVYPVGLGLQLLTPLGEG